MKWLTSARVDNFSIRKANKGLLVLVSALKLAPMNCAIGWPLHDIVSLRGLFARINHPFMVSPTCIAHTVAILLQYYCAIFDLPPTPPLCMPYTIQ